MDHLNIMSMATTLFNLYTCYTLDRAMRVASASAAMALCMVLGSFTSLISTFPTWTPHWSVAISCK